MAEIKTYEDAKEIYAIIKDTLEWGDDDIAGLYLDMISRAVRYASIRAGWNALSRDQKADQDPSRTMAHDAFIMSVNIVARTEGAVGAEWRKRLSEDRKRVGDFACYLALFQGIEAR